MSCRYESPRSYRDYGEMWRHVPCDGVVTAAAAAAAVMNKVALISLFYFHFQREGLLH